MTRSIGSGRGRSRAGAAVRAVLFSLVLASCGQDPDFDDAEGVQLELAGGTYAFGTSTTTGKCVDVTGAGTANGTQIQQWTCHGGSAQSFRVENSGGTARLVHTGSNKCLDVNGAASADGTK